MEIFKKHFFAFIYLVSMKNIPFHSRVEERLVHAEDPIAIDEKLYQEITINGEKGRFTEKNIFLFQALSQLLICVLKACG